MTAVKVWPLLLLPFSLVCMGKDCSLPVLNGTVVLSSESILKNSFPDNSKAFLECPKGQERKYGPPFITCLNEIDCGEPKSSPHMTYIKRDGTLFGAYIQPVCERGYDLEGTAHRQCLVSGWSGNVECILTTCELPDPVEHGRFITPKDEPVFNDTIEFSCDENYVLVGKSSITCSDYGEYDSPPPKCKVTTCKLPDPVEHGRFITPKDEPVFNDTIEFSCDENYVLVGNSSITCSDYGEYDSPPPKCKVTTCELPDPVEHGRFIAPRDEPVFNDVITFSCDENYVLVGNSSITCSDYGEYDSPPPKCKDIMCKSTELSRCLHNMRNVELDKIAKADNVLNFSPVIITMKKGSTTTNKVRTTAYILSHEKLDDQPTTSLPSGSWNVTLAWTLVTLVTLTVAVVVLASFYYTSKHRGSYNTGEELRTKGELLLNQSV
ncbi:complement decay-accelerating factor isoform X2 [Labeo rohita]|uniref:complement decay-accelerating factor isoform X2 n=1 Tax=Labeo rohita TaxID=84645 RepID=UPI0021E211E2|nr:complement decay-accelerating factor isoform X2 [Labeo rohita]